MDLLDNIIENLITTDSAKIVDDSLKENAEFADKAGLEIRVTRVYDGVGLSNERQCQWCLERCGNDMTLAEAYEKGAFQRHPGCGCYIEYTSKKGKKTYSTDKWDWHDVPDSDTLERRKEYGIEESSSARNSFLRKVRFKTSSMSSKEYAEYKAELSAYKNAEQIILPKDEYAMVMSELNTNMSSEDRKHAIVSKPIGDYWYTIINNGFDDYVIIGKRPIDSNIIDSF